MAAQSLRQLALLAERVAVALVVAQQTPLLLAQQIQAAGAAVLMRAAAMAQAVLALSSYPRLSQQLQQQAHQQ